MKKPRIFKEVRFKLPKLVTKKKKKPFTVNTANINEVFRNLRKSIKDGGTHVDLGANSEAALDVIRVFEVNRKKEAARERRAGKRIDHQLTVMGIPTFSIVKWYRVLFEHIYPDCPPYEDNPKTAFVDARSFGEAAEKVENKYKKEFERADIKAVIVADADFIIHSVGN